MIAPPDEPCHDHAVLASRLEPDSASVAAADALVGRETELARLSAFLRAVGSPRALIIEGEAGLGKTSLWRAGVSTARERGLRVLACRPSGADINLSFTGLGDLLRDDVDSILPALPAPQRRSLEAALVLADPLETGADYRTLGLAMLGVLRARAEDGPFVVAIDDLQWLDAPSARVLEFALRRLDSAPLAFLASFRTGDASRAPFDLEQAFPLRAQRIRLGPLSLGAVHELLRRRLGLSLSRPVLVRLHATTSGNPFYALEIARALEDTADPAELHTLPLTASLREVVQRRLRGLPAGTRQTLLAAAALSRPTGAVLAAWAGSGDRVTRDLERARRAGIVGLEGERIEFTHPLLAAGVYEETGVAERRRMHGDLARVLSDPEERAHHLARAAGGPDRAVVSALREAATFARARGAPDAALELLEEAIRLSGPEQTDEISSLALDAAETAHTVGDHARARRLLERVVAEQATGPLRAQALVLLTRVVHEYEAAARFLYEARAEDVADPRLLSEIERNLAANAWAMVQELSRALGHARAAVSFARTARDEGAYGHALAWLARLEWLAGLAVPEDRPALVQAAGEVGEEPLQLVQGIRFTWADTRYWGDELDEAKATLEELRQEAEIVGNFHGLSPVLQLLALVLWRRGEWETARRHAEEAVGIARSCGDTSGLVAALGTLAFVEAHLGHSDAAGTAAAEGLALAKTTHFRYMELRLRHALGALELSRGAPERACEHLAGVGSSRWAAGYRDPGVVRTVPDEVEALIALGDFRGAREALAPFERYAKMLNRRWALGTSARCRGLLAAAAGNHGAAWDAFDRALDTQQQLPEPYELARTLLAYGVARRRAKNRRAARDLLEEAARIFEQLGATIWAERARGEIGRAGRRLGPRDQLTATERRVAELVTEGRTNKAVAAELFISVKTVEGNLSRIYRKLGVSSRTQLARHFGETADS